MAAIGAILFAWQAMQVVANAKPQAEGTKVPWTNPLLLLLALAAFLYSGCEVSYWGWVPKYLQSLSMTTVAAAVISVFWLAMTFGRAVTGMLAARFSSTTLVMLMMSTSAVMGLLTLFGPHTPFILVLVALTGLAMAGTYGLLLSLTANMFPADAGAALGLVAAMGGAGGAVLPWFTGYLLKFVHWHGALLVPVVGDVFVALLAIAIASMKGSTKCVAR
jgi:fucose permease